MTERPFLFQTSIDESSFLDAKGANQTKMNEPVWSAKGKISAREGMREMSEQTSGSKMRMTSFALRALSRFAVFGPGRLVYGSKGNGGHSRGSWWDLVIGIVGFWRTYSVGD